MPEVSIIIVNWNTKDFLLSCIQLILDRAQKVSKEIIVVDNGSWDGSAKEVRRVFPFVHLIENEKNRGFAKAANQGVRQASGRYVLLLNPDTEIQEGSLERFVAFMDKHPEAGLVGGQLLHSDGSKQNSIANFPSLITELLHKSLLRRLFPKTFLGKETHFSTPIEVDSVIGACMMVRPKAMDQVGLLDEDYFLFLEETDWCYRMKKAGWKVYHFPQAEVIHFQGKSAEAQKKDAKLEYFRSRYHFFKKNRGRWHWFILLVGLVVKLSVKFLFMGTACILTAFAIKKWRNKFFYYTYLLEWHLKGCPEGMGLKTDEKGTPRLGLYV